MTTRLTDAVLWGLGHSLDAGEGIAEPAARGLIEQALRANRLEGLLREAVGLLSELTLRFESKDWPLLWGAQQNARAFLTKANEELGDEA